MVVLVRWLGPLRPPVPHGTCYLADAPLGALLEVTRGLTILSESFLARRRLFTTTLVVERHLADLATAAAYGFGVTGELSATPDYTGPHAWAAALRAAGFDGIASHVRHDPRAELSGIALFGRAGGASDGPLSATARSSPPTYYSSPRPLGSASPRTCLVTRNRRKTVPNTAVFGTISLTSGCCRR